MGHGMGMCCVDIVSERVGDGKGSISCEFVSLVSREVGRRKLEGWSLCFRVRTWLGERDAGPLPRNDGPLLLNDMTLCLRRVRPRGRVEVPGEWHRLLTSRGTAGGSSGFLWW